MNNDLIITLKKLENWIESWRQENNSYTGIISTFWESTLDTIQSNGAHQPPIINAYLNLYQKTNNSEFFQEALKASQFLVNDLDSQTGQYKNLFADMPGKTTGPILNIECNLALLRLYKNHKHILNNPEQYLHVVIDNIEKHLLKKWWDGKVWNNYVANQIAKGGEMFLELHWITNKKKYLEYAINAADWIVEHQIKKGPFKGAVEQSQFDSRLISVYEVVSMPLLYKVYRQTNNTKYHVALKELTGFMRKCELEQGGFMGFFEQSYLLKLINLLSRKLKLLRPFLFSFKNILINSGLPLFIKKKEPIFISRLADILLNIKKSNCDWNIEKHIQLIINNQLESGGIKNCLGTIPLAKNEKWTKSAPIMRWNSFAFELLSYLLPNNTIYKKDLIKINTSLTKIQDYGYFIENQEYFGFLKIENGKILIERLFVKSNPRPIICNLELGEISEKNILIVTPSFPPETGGCSSRMSDFLHFLKQSRFNLHVLTNLIPNYKGKEVFDNVTINRIPLFVSFRSPRRFIGTFVFLWKYILNNRINVIIITIPPGLHAIVTLLVATLLKKKIMIDVRDPWIDGEVFTGTIKLNSWKYYFGRYIEKKLYQKATKIILVYNRLNEQIKNRYGIDSRKTIWIPNGINTKLHSHTILSLHPDVEGKTIFLYQGLIARPQAVDRILGFIPKIIEIIPHSIFVFIGDGESKDALIKKADEQKLDDYILYLNKMSRLEVLQWVSKSDYGIVTLDDKFRYAIPSKTFDYLIFQKPLVIIAPVGGEMDNLMQKYNLGVNLLRDNFRILKPITTDNPIFKDYSREKNAQKLEKLIRDL